MKNKKIKYKKTAKQFPRILIAKKRKLLDLIKKKLMK